MRTNGSRSGPRLLVPIGCILLGLALVLTASAGALIRRTDAGAAATMNPVVNRGTVPTAPDRAGRSSAVPGRPKVRTALGAGSQLLMPRQGVRAVVVTVHDPDRVLEVPLDPRVVGWWARGAAPGDGTGTVVMDGHVNYHGVRGVLAALQDMQAGDPVSIEEPGHRVFGYTVQAVRTYSKAVGIPAEVFRTGGAERLVLITCGGPFDATTGNYQDNIVVYATPSRT